MHAEVINIRKHSKVNRYIENSAESVIIWVQKSDVQEREKYAYESNTKKREA